MKAITIRQPWAWAVIHAGKNIENRSQAFKHRGKVAIHAGQALAGADDFAKVAQLAGRPIGDLITGAVIGAAELVDVHQASWENCTDPDVCKPWGERALEGATGARGRVTHLVLADVRQAVNPVPCPGKLGIWDLPDEVAKDVRVGGFMDPTDGAPTTSVAAPGGLTPALLETLEFERATWASPGRRDAAILERFGHSTTRHIQKVQWLIDQPAALAYDAQLVNRLRSLRDQRTAARTGRARTW